MSAEERKQRQRETFERRKLHIEATTARNMRELEEERGMALRPADTE
jgi:hypothetical protein